MDDINLGICPENSQLLLQLVWSPDIIGIKKRDKIPRRLLEGKITGMALALVFLVDITNSPVSKKGLQDIRGIVFGAIVHNDQLKVPEGLRQNTGNSSRQEPGPVVGWSDYANDRHCTLLKPSMTIIFLGVVYPTLATVLATKGNN